MASRNQGGGCAGCAGCIAIVVVISLVVAAVTSVAALIDPFSWVPPIGKIWGCTDNPSPAGSECDLGRRYPGLWWHVIINFLYAVAAVVLLVAFARVVREYRRARAGRFDSDTAVERYRQARQTLVTVAGLLAGLAAIPIVAALA
jgi:hypothetical protein